MPLVVNLTYEHQQEALTFAQKIFDFKGNDLKKFSSLQSNKQVTIGGELSEAAFRQAFDLPMEKEVYEGGDEGWDYVLEGVRIEVKGITKEGYNLVLSVGKVEDFKADFAVLVVPDWGGPLNRYKIYGFVTKEDLKEKAEVKTFSLTKNQKLLIRKENLTKIESKEHFLEHVKEYKCRNKFQKQKEY